jgi:hypothetical protein
MDGGSRCTGLEPDEDLIRHRRFGDTHRVYLSYHTPLQVLLGLFLGSLLGLLFHFFVEHFLRPNYPRLLSTKLARFVLLRNSGHVSNVWKAEYGWYKEAERTANGTRDESSRSPNGKKEKKRNQMRT